MRVVVYERVGASFHARLDGEFSRGGLGAWSGRGDITVRVLGSLKAGFAWAAALAFGSGILCLC